MWQNAKAPWFCCSHSLPLQPRDSLIHQPIFIEHRPRAKHCARSGNTTIPGHHPHPREPLVSRGILVLLFLDSALGPGLAIQLASPSHRLIQLRSTPLQHWGTKECTTDTFIVVGVPVITHHVGLELFSFILAWRRTQQLSFPLALRLSGPYVQRVPGVFKLNNHARGNPCFLSLSITLPCFMVLTAYITIWNCFLCSFVYLFITSS